MKTIFYLSTLISLSFWSSYAQDTNCAPYPVDKESIIFKNDEVCVLPRSRGGGAFEYFMAELSVKNISDVPIELIIDSVFFHTCDGQIIRMLKEAEAIDYKRHVIWTRFPIPKPTVDTLTNIRLSYAMSLRFAVDEVIQLEMMFPWTDTLTHFERGVNSIIVNGYFVGRKRTPFPIWSWDGKADREFREKAINRKKQWMEEQTK